jgi:hypothetical protein
MRREERQRRDIVAALARGEDARVLALAAEHLAEFRDDEVVHQARDHVRARVGDAGATGPPGRRRSGPR